MPTASSAPRSTSRIRCARSRPIALLLWAVALAQGGGAWAAVDDPPAADALSRLADKPLTLETWPLWRRTYVEIFAVEADDRARERWFNRTIHAFVRAAAGSKGMLPTELAGDAIAWTILGASYLKGPDGGPAKSPTTPEGLERAEEACREAAALGQEPHVTAYNLACVLVVRTSAEARGQPPSPSGLRRLQVAEGLFRQARQDHPSLNTGYWLGTIAGLRGDNPQALALLRDAAREHPKSEETAEGYLFQVVGAAQPGGHAADVSGPFAERFPRNATVLALHAAALFQDGRLPEAANTIRRAREIDEAATQFLGKALVARIETQSPEPPEVADGTRALKQERYEEAEQHFRTALAKHPDEPDAARGLARALVEGAMQRSADDDPSAAAPVIAEVRGLSARFPTDPALQAGLAAALHFGGRDAEAGEALDRVATLGGKAESFFDAHSLRVLRSAAEADRAYQFRVRLTIGIVGGAALWVAVMFLMGAALAAGIPRVPSHGVHTGQERSRREVWLERFYLAVLTLGLVVFYASVPLVAAGLLAVTLAAFVILLVLRVIHIGVLYRGLWAAWNILRCSLIGPSRSTLGVEATEAQHPRLFESLRAVAQRIGTRVVDAVYLTPTSEISVRQEGWGPFGLFGRRRRVLEVGIPLMPLLTRPEFESILAHEYGHFSHNDTFYSRFLFQVSASLSVSLSVMEAAGGMLNYVNPFYGFWWLYLRAYTLLSTGFSRSREFLADRRAAAAYGKSTFVSGLTKVSVEGPLYDATMLPNVGQLLRQGKAFTNAFDAFRATRDDEGMAQARERILKDLQACRPRWFDTHPTYSERLAAVAALPDDPPLGDPEPAVALLSDAEAVEAQLTHLLTAYVRQAMASPGAAFDE